MFLIRSSSLAYPSPQQVSVTAVTWIGAISASLFAKTRASRRIIPPRGSSGAMRDRASTRIIVLSRSSFGSMTQATSTALRNQALIGELLWFYGQSIIGSITIYMHTRTSTASGETKHSLFHRGLVFGLSSVEPRPQHDLHVHHHVHVHGPFPLGASARLVPRPESGDVALHGNVTQTDTRHTSAETLHTSSHQV